VDTLSVLKRDWEAPTTNRPRKYFRAGLYNATSGSHYVCSVGRNHASPAGLEWRRSGAFERPCAGVYAELRLIAGAICLHERQGHTLQATALVHEAYLRLIDLQDVGWQDALTFRCLGADDAPDPGGSRSRPGHRGSGEERRHSLQLDEIPEVGPGAPVS